MATSISKSVPRSRLNITYRTRIDGQVVPKELPLRLLIAGDFSGRGKVQPPDTKKPLPPLAQRVIYSIGKESTLDGVLSRARVSLPIPAGLQTDRRLSLLGQATVRIEKTKNASNKVDFLLTIKSSLIEHAIELETNTDPAAATALASDTKLYSGEVLSLGSFSISTAKGALPVAPTVPAASDPPVEPIEKWRLAQEGANKAQATGMTWKSTAPIEVCGNVTAPVSPAGEPPSLWEVNGKTAVYFCFEDDFEAMLDGDSRDAVEFRVRIIIPQAQARRGIQVANMASFTPERLAMSVPNIRRLLVVRWLLSQGRSLIGSNPALRAQVKSLLAVEEARLDARKALSKSDPLKVAYGAKLQYAKDLLDPSKPAPTAPAPEAEYAAPLRTLVEKTTRTAAEEKEYKRLKTIVTSEWWAAKIAADEAIAGGNTDETLKKNLDAMMASSPWFELTTAIDGIGLEHFTIEGDGK